MLVQTPNNKCIIPSAFKYLLESRCWYIRAIDTRYREVEMEVLDKRTSFKLLENELRYKQFVAKTDVNVLNIIDEFIQEHPEQDLHSIRNNWQCRWTDAALADVEFIRGILHEKRTDAALAFAMTLHARLGQHAAARVLPEAVVRLIFSELYFH